MRPARRTQRPLPKARVEATWAPALPDGLHLQRLGAGAATAAIVSVFLSIRDQQSIFVPFVVLATGLGFFAYRESQRRFGGGSSDDLVVRLELRFRKVLYGWDVGTISFDGGALTFEGQATTFSLARGSVEVGDHRGDMALRLISHPGFTVGLRTLRSGDRRLLARLQEFVSLPPESIEVEQTPPLVARQIDPRFVGAASAATTLCFAAYFAFGRAPWLGQTGVCCVVWLLFEISDVVVAFALRQLARLRRRRVA